MLKKVGHRHLQIRVVLEPVATFFSYRARPPAGASSRAPEAPAHGNAGA
jgi:hypothetical protein